MGSSTTTNPSSFPNYPSTVIAANFVSAKLENSNNYFSWKQQILCLIESQDLLPFIDGTITPPQPEDKVAWRTDRVVKGWILGALAGPVLNNVSKLCNARDVWLALEEEFTQSEAAIITPPLEASISTPPPSTSQPQDEPHDHLPLYRATLMGDWGKAKQIIGNDPHAATARFSFGMETPLHIAVGTGNANHFVKQLVDLMTDEQLGVTDNLGYTALHMAAATGNTEAAEVLLGRRPDLINVANNDGKFPVHFAALLAHKKTLRYLIFRTKDDLSRSPAYRDETGLELLCYVIHAEIYDIAFYLAKQYPDLATIKLNTSISALLTLTLKLSAFSRGERQLNLWERFLYTAFWVINVPVPRGKTALLRKNKYQHALELVKCLCKNMERLDFHRASGIYIDVMLIAARFGVHEVIEELVATFPQAIHSMNSYTGQNIFHVAVENRNEKVYNLTYQTSNLKHCYSDTTDKSGNTLLHLAGKLAPSHRLNLVSGAALQMQRELQWFYEVQKFVNPHSRELINNDGMTPKVVFTKEHAELKIEGEKWMKDTANSCTIVAALIVTVVFAAAITVPGGNEGNTGFPIFSRSDSFIIFAISDAISLFTSTTSLLMFLSILTSRYAEHDFLFALPKRLCIGLATLFLSISFMMVAFAATIWIVFGRMKAWILIPVGVLSCLPVTSFVLLQFPLLVDVISSTYGRGIFGKQSNRPFY